MEVDHKISDEFSFEKEKAIAKSLSHRFQWEMIAIGVGQATIFLSLWPLTLMGYIPLWAGFLIATLCACLAYLPSHEAQHGNYSRGNPKKRWIDSLVGNFTLITLIYPYEILRVTHMKHHAYTNHPTNHLLDWKYIYIYLLTAKFSAAVLRILEMTRIPMFVQFVWDIQVFFLF